VASGNTWMPLSILSLQNLPFWAKSLIAPAIVLIVMFAMAGTAFVDLGNQKTDVANLDSVAFEGLLQTMVVTTAVTDIQTELYHLSSIAANEADKSKVDATATRLNAQLDDIAEQITAVTAHTNDPHAGAATRLRAIAETFVAYRWAARQMIEFTRSDAAYGVLMMGFVEEYFAQLRGLLTETVAHAQMHRSEATTDLLANLALMRLALLALVLVGAGVSITVAMLVARAISVPTVRLTRTMVALAAGTIEVEIPDQQRRDELGAMASAVEIFKRNMVNERRLSREIERLAYHDALTGLPNRVLFHAKVEHALQ
jgi:HAMP domain-containing protein